MAKSAWVVLAVSILLGGCTKKGTENPAPKDINPRIDNGINSPVIDGQPAGNRTSGNYKGPLKDNFFDAYDTVGLTPAEKRGRAIWYQGTLGNGVFHTTVLQQRFGVLIDWHSILKSERRNSRFKDWGLVSDPDCVPGDDSTFGFDRCPGDDELTAFIGKSGYKDPACNLEQKISGGVIPFQREDACRLAFGTSTGAIGFRKFPNPKFNLDSWQRLNGGKNFSKYQGARLGDASVEPPYLIGMSCAGCHVGINPLRPPTDIEHPHWDNISGTIGGQHSHVSEMLGSGLPTSHLLVQALTNSQAGATDTSAVPHDEIFNPGTINALFNTDIRVMETSTPKRVTRQRRNADGTFTDRETKLDKTPNILKGGEDDIGPDLAVQRVYVNIGMCSRECWVNHLTNIKSLTGRHATQSPFDINQCRRDCGEWRALEDRVGDVISFLLTRRPVDLKDAVDKDGNRVGESRISAIQAATVEFDGKKIDKLELGRQTFAKNCASCHSSQRPTRPGQARDANFFLSIKDFRKTKKMEIKDGDTVARVDEVRIDWMGNDAPTSADVLKTNRCRALHTNHMTGHVWEEFSSEDYKKRATVIGIPETAVDGAGGGRGYYRNISLLSVWATAPFLHNNAVGPTLCSHVPVYEESIRKQGGKPPDTQVDCIEPYSSVTVEDRIALFEQSMVALLNPGQRGKKVMRTYEDITLELGPKIDVDALNALKSNSLAGLAALGDPAALNRFELKIPKGTPVALLASLNERAFVSAQIDRIASSSTPTEERYAKIVAEFEKLSSDPELLREELAKYSNCSDLEEDKGHEFGASLSGVEQDALIQFLKTL